MKMQVYRAQDKRSAALSMALNICGMDGCAKGKDSDGATNNLSQLAGMIPQNINNITILLVFSYQTSCQGLLAPQNEYGRPDE